MSDKTLDSKEGLKYDSDKPDMSLLSSTALVELTRVLDFGKKKYAAHNWRNGISSTRLLAAALRHIFAYLGGEDKDPETGLSHIAHAMCCCMFILELKITHPHLDDRYGISKKIPEFAVNSKKVVGSTLIPARSVNNKLVPSFCKFTAKCGYPQCDCGVERIE